MTKHFRTAAQKLTDKLLAHHMISNNWPTYQYLLWMHVEVKKIFLIIVLSPVKEPT